MDRSSLAGTLRRIRRLADCSQRELADRIGASKTAIAGAENGTRDLPVSVLARAADVVGGRLAVLDAAGTELVPMTDDAVRDAADRLFPAHLDTRHGDDGWWGGEHRPRTRQPRYTFDIDRRLRDSRRGDGTAADHHVPTAGDSLAERRAARRADSWRRVAEERERHFLAHAGRTTPDPFTCTCLPGCDEVAQPDDDLEHADDCACRCDLD